MGHSDGFQHLEFEGDGLESQFDLGCRFEEKESEHFEIDPNTGSKSWAEPYLALWISVSRPGMGDGCTGTLRYGLTRSKWQEPACSTQEDRGRLLELVRARLGADLRELEQGRTPQAFSELVQL
jgi:hypothetical protein